MYKRKKPPPPRDTPIVKNTKRSGKESLKPLSEQGRDNYDEIFRKKKKIQPPK